MILCVGLTPTVQRTLRFDRFEVGAVNRATETLVTASGKAVNVARVVSTLGAPVLLLQMLGGDMGHFVARALEAEGVPQETVWLVDDAPTRTCTTLLVKGGGATTELVEEARPVTESEVNTVWERATALLAGGTVRALCLSGSLPPGAPPDLYARLVREAREANLPALVDAQRTPLALSLAERPFLVKPNVSEAAATLSLTLSGDTEADALAAVRALLAAGAQWALVSAGRAGALLGGAESRDRWWIEPPQVEAVNPIGSGDSLLAGLLVAHFARGESVPDAVAFGTACAAANCLSATSGVVNPEDAARLRPLVQMRRL